MNILDLIINFFNVTDSENLVKKNWNILSDKSEFLGERIKSFFSFILLILAYLFLIIFTIYLIYIFIFK
jgi:hypothetical protein